MLEPKITKKGVERAEPLELIFRIAYTEMTALRRTNEILRINLVL